MAYAFSCFIPMFVELGLTPEYTQLAYRIGDSTTNIISPLMSYFLLQLDLYKYKNEEDMGLGTVIAMMLPYSIVFLVAWTILFLAWTFLGIPIDLSKYVYVININYLSEQKIKNKIVFFK